MKVSKRVVLNIFMHLLLCHSVAKTEIATVVFHYNLVYLFQIVLRFLLFLIIFRLRWLRRSWGWTWRWRWWWWVTRWLFRFRLPGWWLWFTIILNFLFFSLVNDWALLLNLNRLYLWKLRNLPSIFVETTALRLAFYFDFDLLSWISSILKIYKLLDLLFESVFNFSNLWLLNLLYWPF
jgi:hypothetical protein